MNTKTTTKHTITVNAADMKKRFCITFMTILNDSLNVDIGMEFFETDLNRYHDNFNDINKNGFRQAFKEGYASMLLSDKEFSYVEEWFNKPGSEQEELYIRILDKDGNQQELVHLDCLK